MFGESLLALHGTPNADEGIHKKFNSLVRSCNQLLLYDDLFNK